MNDKTKPQPPAGYELLETPTPLRHGDLMFPEYKSPGNGNTIGVTVGEWQPVIQHRPLALNYTFARKAAQ